MRRLAILWLLLCHAAFGSIIEKQSNGAGAGPGKGEPAPLLTPDYGIVTNADRNKDIRSGIPFLPAPGQYLVYWQCLRLDKVKMHCGGYTKYSRGLGPKTSPCIIGIEVVSENEFFDFFFDHVWDWEGFEDIRKEWKKLFRGQKIACFAAEYVEEETSVRPRYIRSTSWFLKRIRTRLGKWAYFHD